MIHKLIVYAGHRLMSNERIWTHYVISSTGFFVSLFTKCTGKVMMKNKTLENNSSHQDPSFVNMYYALMCSSHTYLKYTADSS